MFKLKFLIYTNFIHISIIIIIKFSVLNWLDLYVRMKKYYKLIYYGEMSEWSKEHAWNACVGETLPRVQIPLSPPCRARWGVSGAL